jgi:ribosomal protein S18 acetylase RimI-like enzyme
MNTKNAMNTDVNIRPFEPGDYDAVIALWNESGLPSKPQGRDSREKMLREVTRETATFLVAESGGKMIGTVLATHDGRKGWINRLATAPKFRSRGIARQLLEAAETALYERGLEIVACLIEDYNDASMQFFNKAGYVKHTDIFYFSKRKHPDV